MSAAASPCSLRGPDPSWQSNRGVYQDHFGAAGAIRRARKLQTSPKLRSGRTGSGAQLGFTPADQTLRKAIGSRGFPPGSVHLCDELDPLDRAAQRLREASRGVRDQLDGLAVDVLLSLAKGRTREGKSR